MALPAPVEVLLRYASSEEMLPEVPGWVATGPIGAFFGGFFAVYVVALGVFVAMGWRSRRGNRMEVASCVASVVHGSAAVLVSFKVLAAEVLLSGWAIDLANSNSTLGDFFLRFSTGYFLFDSVQLLFHDPNALFLLHHFAVCSMMYSSLVLGVGNHTPLVLAFFGEVTSPCLNLWLIMRDGQDQSRLLKQSFLFYSPFFTVFYAVVRMMLAPFVIFYITVFWARLLVDGASPLGPWLTLFWIALANGGLIVRNLVGTTLDVLIYRG